MLLFLVAMGGIEPTPIWRPSITILAGAAVVTILLTYVDMPFWTFGPYVADAAAIGLLFLGSLELRGLIT